MRKLLFVFIGLMFTMNGFSQAYHPIPTDSVWWVELHSGLYGGGGSPCVQSNYDYIYAAGNTVIQGSSYTEFRARTVIEYDYFGPPPSFCPPNNDLVPDHLYAFIRNDSVNKKVLLYDSSGTHSDIVLYDFDMLIGDTIAPPGNGYGYPCMGDTFTVVNIDSVSVGGEYRKRYEITSSNGPWYPIYLIEGIGSNYGFAFNLYCPFEYTSNLLCYHYKQFEYGDVSSSYCTSTLNIENNIPDALSFVKRSGADQFDILNSNHQEINIECYDMTGKYVLGKSFQESGSLDLSSQSTGIYLMYLKVDGQLVKPYKFIVTH